MNQIVTAKEIETARKPLRTPSIILAEATTVGERQLIDFFSRLSARQREAIYAIRQHGHLEKMRDKWHAPGHVEFTGKIICCLCDAGLAKLVIGRVYKRMAHTAELTPVGHRMMKAVESLDAVFFRNISEIGAGT